MYAWFLPRPFFASSDTKISFVQTNENAKIILANAVRELPQSVRIWMAAVDLEREVKGKKNVLRKGVFEDSG